MAKRDIDQSLLDDLELSVLRLSEAVDRKIEEVAQYAGTLNDSASKSAFNMLEVLKTKQAELSRVVDRIKSVGRTQQAEMNS